MKNTIMVLVALTLTLGNVQADTLLARLDAKEGREPGYTFGLMMEEGLEVWAFALPSFPIIEVGYTHYFSLGEKDGVLAGGYVSRWCEVDEWYLEPIGIGFAQLGDWKLKAFWGAYAPLNGGSWQLYSNPTQLVTPITSTLDMGVAGTCWFTEGSKPTFGFGPMATWRAGDLTLSARALAGVNQPNSLRLELTTSF